MCAAHEWQTKYIKKKFVLNSVFLKEGASKIGRHLRWVASFTTKGQLSVYSVDMTGYVIIVGRASRVQKCERGLGI
jgi:hypothetical protein